MGKGTCLSGLCPQGVWLSLSVLATVDIGMWLLVISVMFRPPGDVPLTSNIIQRNCWCESVTQAANRNRT